MRHAVRLAESASDLIEGVGIPFGGPWLGADGQGRDLYGEFFSAKTELCLDWFPERPLLYQHGFDVAAGTSVVGRVRAWEVKADQGIWVQAQLDSSSEYFESLKELIQRGKLYFSSGSVEHLFRSAPDGEILMWPWIELSLTPNPANLYAKIDQPTAEKHWQASGLSVKAFVDRVKALPSNPTPADGEHGYPPGSYEALQCALNRAVSRVLCADEWDCWCCVVATFPDYVVACCCEYDGDTEYYEIAYTLDASGMPVLGEQRRVERVYQPVEMPPADEAMTAVMSAYTVRSATTLAARFRALHEGRAREGRVLSTGNRRRLRAAHEALAGLMADYAALLADTEPKTNAEAGAARAVVEVQAAHARILALASGLEVSP